MTRDGPAADSRSSGRRHRRKGSWLIALMAVLAGAVVVIVVSDPFSSSALRRTSVTDNSSKTALYTVTRGAISSQITVNGTLGYGGSYGVVNEAQGTLTALPAVGQVVTQGQVLYRVNGAPVVLLYGSTPAYRTLSSGLTGADISELNADLVALGDATPDEIPAGSVMFTGTTVSALENLQASLGLPQTGTLALGSAVFVPSALRVTVVSGLLGGPAQAGQAVLQGTSTTREVMIGLDAARQAQVQAGDKVTITLPNGRSTPGMVSSVGAVAISPSPSQGGGGNTNPPTITVLVRPTDSADTGVWDQAPVNVTITTDSVSDALIVPVDALLAQAGGGYAVEVVGAHGTHHLVLVNLGLFDDADGLVQASGSALTAGQRVVVPAL